MEDGKERIKKGMEMGIVEERKGEVRGKGSDIEGKK